jgi:hypothetical protein
MSSELVEKTLESSVTRRRIIGSGAKLAYAAPLVAASYKLGSSAVVAAVSGECAATGCGSDVTCGGSTSCYCRQTGNTTTCFQNRLCENPKSHPCSSSATCTDAPGGYCMSKELNCCGDTSRCVYPCSTGATSAVHSSGFSADDVVVTSGTGVLGPDYILD